MMKKSLSLLAALTLAATPALAETYAGTTVASRTTALELDGSIYGALRTQGLVAKDFTLEISAEGQRVSVNGAQYLLNGGELATK